MKRKILCVVGTSSEAIKTASKILLLKAEQWPRAQEHFA